ncbi:MAG: succinate dehydrogenase flavoprotein subunit [Planctomycetota bacterium]|nr:succinate dehydrogenase flavoprotein subunit [Planctomycetota bacterium]
MARLNVVMVGGGLAGLAGAMKLAKLGIHVDLVSMTPVKRSHSVCAQGGINSVNNQTRELGDSEWMHFDDTVYGGDFLNNQPPVKEMCDWGPRVIDLLDRLGVPFNRTSEGNLDRRRFGGTLYKRTAFSGATTGQQLIYALDEQVRRWETDGLIDKYECWEFLGPILDGNGVCRGCIVQDMFSMQIRVLKGDAVIMAVGGCGLIFGKSTMSMICTGGANARAYQAGVKYANGEFIQVHPTAVPGTDKLRLMSESARGEGGRVWVPRKPQDDRDPSSIPESERYYFLEERYPTYGNLVPRDIATREIFDVCVNQGLSVEPDKQCVYLDLTHLSEATLRKLEGILAIYEKFQGADPRKTAMKIFPAVHYSMGGLWVDFEKNDRTGGMVIGSQRNQATNIPGLYAIGECDYQYHGANRLGANSLLSCIFSGLIVAPTIENYLKSRRASVRDVAASVFDAAVRLHRDRHDEMVARTGDENAYALHEELGRIMTAGVTVVRHNKKIEETLAKLDEIAERFRRCPLADKGDWTNQNLSFTRALGDMIILARAITLGALRRDECRGAHYKPEFTIPELDPENGGDLKAQARSWCKAFKSNIDRFLKTTLAEHTPEGPRISSEEVDTSLIPPRPRTYGLKGAEDIERIWRTEFQDRPNLKAAPTGVGA